MLHYIFYSQPASQPALACSCLASENMNLYFRTLTIMLIMCSHPSLVRRDDMQRGTRTRVQKGFSSVSWKWKWESFTIRLQKLFKNWYQTVVNPQHSSTPHSTPPCPAHLLVHCVGSKRPARRWWLSQRNLDLAKVRGGRSENISQGVSPLTLSNKASEPCNTACSWQFKSSCPFPLLAMQCRRNARRRHQLWP